MVWKGSNLMNAQYNQLITETFCDNAIRSVMMIDDDYTPYHKLVEVSKSASELSEIKDVLKASERASKIQKFFEDKKFICDVSDGLESFDPEKARKSDLLILDYQLKNDSPELSLSILKKLSSTKHMNLVVVYTNEDLEHVWLEIAASMSGLHALDPENEIPDDFKTVWNQMTEGGDELPDEWEQIAKEDIARYLKNDRANYKVIGNKIATEHKKYTKNICNASLMMKAQEFDKLGAAQGEKLDIKGSFNGNLWLKFGNVFVTLHQKADEDNAENLWKSLTDSLIDWQPNYFRLISSEIQNQIENGAVTLNSYLSSDYTSQAAWLWQILKNWDKKDLELKKLLDNNTDSFKDNVILSDEVLGFAERVCAQLLDGFPQQENDEDNKDREQMEYVSRHASKTVNTNDDSLPATIAHSLNCSLSTKDFSSTYITTGTILQSDDSDDWLLCVSPACDTVPEQSNTCLSKRLAPNFKLLKFIRLEKINRTSALSKATEGICLFLDNGVSLQTSSTPNLEYAISHIGETDADCFNLTLFKSKNTDKTEKDVVFGVENDQVLSDTKKFNVRAQLKDSYAARYQALASHHVGRIGVDYINYSS